MLAAGWPGNFSDHVGHVQPGTTFLRTGDGGLDKRHARHTVGNAGVGERPRARLAPGGADRPFPGVLVQVGQRLVEPLGEGRRGAGGMA